MGIFAELADNGLLGCSRVVGADSRKCGHLAGHLCALWLAGGAGPMSARQAHWIRNENLLRKLHTSFSLFYQSSLKSSLVL